MQRGVFLLFLLAAKLSAFTGNWYTENRESIVQIEQSNGVYHGRIIWLKEPFDSLGNPWLDEENPDPALRKQPLIGLTLLSGCLEEGKRLTKGSIYDPNSGKTYSCTISRNRENVLVRGYLGFSLFGRSEMWEPCKILPKEIR